MNCEYFVKAYKYDSAVNRQILRQMQGILDVPRRAVAIFAHLLTAKKIWLARMEGLQTDMPIWPDARLNECAVLLDENQQGYASFLQGKTADELSENVTYHNSKGTLFQTAISDILTHVLIHGGYHRGQIAPLLKQAGHQPVNTDFITYVRPK